MKKATLSLFTIIMSASSFAQVTDTVTLGANYINQVWYSLQNDEQGTQPKDNWDLGFEIAGSSASIIANTQKANFVVYKAPYSIANYATIDTTGMYSTWQKVYNSDTTWSIGALNKGITANPFDLGWGIYDMSTHFVNGDSVFVVKLSATTFKKLKIDNLASGIYNFTYANVDGSSPQTFSLQKSTYTGKNFGYYDLTNNVEVNREPATANWDLTFVKYTTFIPSAYGVTGVLSNKAVKVAQADNVPSPVTYNNYAAHTFKTAINEIGYDFKNFNMTTFVYDMSLDTVYFVKTAANQIWKLRFTGFTGSADGKFIFDKEFLATTGINDAAGNTISQFTLYPNPATGDNLNMLFASEKNIENVTVQITDLTGKVVMSEQMNLTEGFNNYTTSVSGLNSGLYFVQLSTLEFRSVQKFVKP